MTCASDLELSPGSLNGRGPGGSAPSVSADHVTVRVIVVIGRSE